MAPTSFEDHVDDDGILDKPIRIHARLTVGGDELMVDLSGRSRRVWGRAMNVVVDMPDGLLCADCFGRRTYCCESGCYRPVKIVAPAGLCAGGRAGARRDRIAIGHGLATALSAGCIRPCRSSCEQRITCPMSNATDHRSRLAVVFLSRSGRWYRALPVSDGRRRFRSACITMRTSRWR